MSLNFNQVNMGLDVKVQTGEQSYTFEIESPGHDYSPGDPINIVYENDDYFDLENPGSSSSDNDFNQAEPNEAELDDADADLAAVGGLDQPDKKVRESIELDGSEIYEILSDGVREDGQEVNVDSMAATVSYQTGFTAHDCDLAYWQAMSDDKESRANPEDLVRATEMLVDSASELPYVNESGEIVEEPPREALAGNGFILDGL